MQSFVDDAAVEENDDGESVGSNGEDDADDAEDTGADLAGFIVDEADEEEAVEEEEAEAPRRKRRRRPEAPPLLVHNEEALPEARPARKPRREAEAGAVVISREALRRQHRLDLDDLDFVIYFLNPSTLSEFITKLESVLTVGTFRIAAAPSGETEDKGTMQLVATMMSIMDLFATIRTCVWVAGDAAFFSVDLLCMKTRLAGLNPAWNMLLYKRRGADCIVALEFNQNAPTTRSQRIMPLRDDFDPAECDFTVPAYPHVVQIHTQSADLRNAIAQAESKIRIGVRRIVGRDVFITEFSALSDAGAPCVYTFERPSVATRVRAGGTAPLVIETVDGVANVADADEIADAPKEIVAEGTFPIRYLKPFVGRVQSLALSLGATGSNVPLIVDYELGNDCKVVLRLATVSSEST